jgi:hypothetical protein
MRRWRPKLSKKNGPNLPRGKWRPMAGYQQGEFSLLHVLTARQTWFQSNLAYIEAGTELKKVLVEIAGLQLTGGLNPATLGTAIQTQAGLRQRGLLNQLQDTNTRPILPGSIQAIER